jgi:type II secretory pathway component PulF
MSAGNLLGTLFVSVMASALWIVLGFAIDKIARVFNHTMQVLPTFQDAANGFTITQTIWGFLLVIIWIALWVNYAQNEASEAGGYV